MSASHRKPIAAIGRTPVRVGASRLNGAMMMSIQNSSTQVSLTVESTNASRSPISSDQAAVPGTGELSRKIDALTAKVDSLIATVEGHRKAFLTVPEFAKIVGRSPYTVREWIKAGMVSATRIQGTGPKGRLLIRREELDRILAQGVGASVTPIATVAA